MGNLDTILENISEYEGDVQTLVKHLRNNNINSIEEFKAVLRTEGIAVRRAMLNEIENCFNGSEDDDWNEACAADTLESYRRYIIAYPEGAHISEARERMAAIQQKEAFGQVNSIWESVDKDSIESLKEFCRNHPGSEHYAEATALIRKLEVELYSGVCINCFDLLF